MTRRDELMRDIAQIDEQINRAIGSTQLPDIKVRPFPMGSWIIAILCYAWAKFGDQIPGAFIYHSQTAMYAYYATLVLIMLALFRTLMWFMRGRGYQEKSDMYMAASRDARDLQTRRRELQAELRALTEE